MTTITEVVPSLGSVPTTAGPATFDSRADALLGAALPAFRDSVNTLSGQINTVSGEVNVSAATASSAAVLAVAAANATLWVSGKAYIEGEAAISTIDLQAYRANTATSGTTDPSASSDWTLVTIGAPPGGAMTYISTVTASAAAAVDVEGFDSTYDRYVIRCDDLVLSTNGQLQGRVKIAGSYVTTATYNSGMSSVDSVTTSYSGYALSAATSMLIAGQYGSTTKGALEVEISIPSDTTAPKVVASRGIGMPSTTNSNLCTAGGANSSTGAVTGISMFNPYGYAITGAFHLYGIKNS